MNRENRTSIFRLVHRPRWIATVVNFRVSPGARP